LLFGSKNSGHNRDLFLVAVGFDSGEIGENGESGTGCDSGDLVTVISVMVWVAAVAR
jgi:hypothetical protein